MLLTATQLRRAATSAGGSRVPLSPLISGHRLSLAAVVHTMFRCQRGSSMHGLSRRRKDAAQQGRAKGGDTTYALSSSRLRTFSGSILMPGPIVVVIVIDLR